jgi:hypothetical protein
VNGWHSQRRLFSDARLPDLLQPVAIHPAPSHTRLREFTIDNAMLQTPGGHSPVTAVGQVIAGLFVGEQMGERHTGIQLGQFFNYFAMGNDYIGLAFAQMMPQALYRLPLSM